jgi:hypothetical protein
MQNYVSIHEHQTKPDPALAAVQGQAPLLLRYDLPSYYVSPGGPGCHRTELPDDMVFQAIRLGQSLGKIMDLAIQGLD